MKQDAHITVTTVPVFRADAAGACWWPWLRLPAVAAVVMSSVFVSTRRRLRELVPAI